MTDPQEADRLAAAVLAAEARNGAGYCKCGRAADHKGPCWARRGHDGPSPGAEDPVTGKRIFPRVTVSVTPDTEPAGQVQAILASRGEPAPDPRPATATPLEAELEAHCTVLRALEGLGWEAVARILTTAADRHGRLLAMGPRPTSSP